MTAIAIFPGTFDPITLGHQDLIIRLSKLFDSVIVAVAANTAKSPLFSLPARVDMITQIMQGQKNVRVEGFSNLLIDFARQHNATIVVRGVRATSDFEYELQLANMNRCLDQNLETLFLPPSEKYAFISSTLVKEISRLGGDLQQFVSPSVVQMLKGVKWR